MGLQAQGNQNHGTGELIESYILGTLPEADVATFEEHMFICEACRERTEQAQDFVIGVRQAFREGAQPAVTPRADWFGWLRKPAGAMALAFVALLAVLAIIFSPGRNALPAVATLQLTATRGEMPWVKPARELDLTLAGAPVDGGPFRVEVLDAQGHNIWGGLADSEGDAVVMKVQARIQPGNYFVRLYSADGPLVREYGFEVRN